MKDIYILGVGCNTVVYIDLVESCGYRVVGLYHYEEGRTGEIYFGHKIIGSNEELFSLDLSGKQFAISVGDNKIRSSLYNKILYKSKRRIAKFLGNFCYIKLPFFHISMR